MKEVLAMILAGGASGPLEILALHRAKVSIPFGGKYRLIDFVLSNCANSEIYKIGILAQYSPKSLLEHIKSGKSWDLDRASGGVYILQPYLRRETTVSNWYRGTAEALYSNLDFIIANNCKYVLVLSGDQIYKMDYRQLVEFHRSKKAKVTIGVTEIDPRLAHQFGIVKLDKEAKVIEFCEKPAQPQTNIAFMGVYLFDTDFLIENLLNLEKENKTDLVTDLLLPLIEQGKEDVFAYQFKGFFRDIGTYADYFEANLSLLNSNTTDGLNLYDRNWIIHTSDERKPPVQFGPEAKVTNSLIANGCKINGVVKNSILFAGVSVEKNATVTNSIIMHRTKICSHSFINYAVLDKDIYIGINSKIGTSLDFVSPELLEQTLVVIGKGAHIPDNSIIREGTRIPFQRI